MTLSPNGSTSEAASSHGVPARHLSFTSIEVGLLLLAGGLGFLSDQFSLPILARPAQLFGGLLFAVLGIEQIVSRLGIYRRDGTYSQVVEIYKALVVQLWGLIILALGLMVAFGAILEWINPGSANAIWNGLLDQSSTIGLVVAGLGLMTMLHGVIRLLSGRADSEQPRIAGALDALYRAAGALTIFLGLVLMLVGLFVALAPDAVSSLISSLGAIIGVP